MQRWKDMTGRRRMFEVLFWMLVIIGVLQLGFYLRPFYTGTKLPFVYFVGPFFVATAAHAIYMLGLRRAALFFGLCVLICFGAEYIGSTTGLIFGAYHYSDDPQVQATVTGVKLLGHVPWTIPAVWFVMLYPSHIITNLALEGQPFADNRGLWRVVWMAFVGAFVITAWDLTMDPYSVGIQKAWIWHNPGAYLADIPFSNFYGWLGTTFVFFLAYRLIEPRVKGQEREIVRSTWLGKIVIAAPLSTYAFMCASDLIFGHPAEAAMISPFAMGFPLFVAGTRLAQWVQSEES